MENECRILLGEDDLIVAKSIKVFLEKKGLKIIEIVQTGEELIKKALYNFPSMIITDITLKGQLDGIEAISRISEILKVPYIFITGFREYLSVIKSYDLNPSKIFIKPLDLNSLYNSIREIFVPAADMPSYYIG